MGLVLDEPRDGDESYQIDGVPMVLDPFAMKVVKDSGGLNIKNSMFGPMAELNGATGSCSC
jgi:hypothetical protein